ncbi:M24 family metallopeptidase [Chelatococcus asaccharovorans]|uniref:Xaa-Pro aminopeptidase n=1 Tax=Chelatococcus asaccharovorans TaxID=28210 RepID=A0A2V3UAW9_9HYPH|nr:Xaa-Pro peptidase family protein [Chelatococcus asaccharovorans]PXW55317.1 Xaa-Pro aminopeptidase [Chelatococcus asaccharovorans]
MTLHATLSPREEIITRQVAAMRSDGLDANISCSPEGFAHLTGFVVPSQPLIRHRHAMAILSAAGDLSLFGVDMEESTIRRQAPAPHLTVWAEFRDDPMAVLADRLTTLGLGSARIGIELDYLPAADFARLVRLMPAARFEPIDAMLARLRQIKTPAEIALLRELSRIADRAIADAYAAVGPGSSEMDIAAALTRRVYELGAEHFKLLIVATGERSQLPNVGPTARILQKGDICRVEIFAVRAGYQAGVCRTAYVVEPPPMAEKIWSLLADCKQRILDQVRPGASCLAIYQDFIGRLATMNLPPISFVAHGIGLHLHEDPYIGETPTIGRPGQDTRLEDGMVLGFEPLCYRTGFGYGMQNKDLLCVTASGAELLSDHTNTDRLIRVG